MEQPILNRDDMVQNGQFSKTKSSFSINILIIFLPLWMAFRESVYVFQFGRPTDLTSGFKGQTISWIDDLQITLIFMFAALIFIEIFLTNQKVRFNSETWLLVILWILIALHPPVSWGGKLDLGTICLLVVLLAIIFAKSSGLFANPRAILFASTCIVLLSLLWLIVDQKTAVFGIARLVSGDGMSYRLAGVSSHPNVLGFISGLSIIGFAVTPVHFLYKILFISIASICLIFTESRSAFLATSVSLLVFAFLFFKKQIKIYVYFIFTAILVLAMGIYTLAFTNPNEPLLQFFSGRQIIWSEILHSYLLPTIFGNKPGSLLDFAVSNPFLFFAARDAHSSYISILVNFGIAGLVVMLWLYALKLNRQHAASGVSILTFFAFIAITESFLDPSLGILNLWVLVIALFAKWEFAQRDLESHK